MVGPSAPGVLFLLVDAPSKLEGGLEAVCSRAGGGRGRSKRLEAGFPAGGCFGSGQPAASRYAGSAHHAANVTATVRGAHPQCPAAARGSCCGTVPALGCGCGCCGTEGAATRGCGFYCCACHRAHCRCGCCDVGPCPCCDCFYALCLCCGCGAPPCSKAGVSAGAIEESVNGRGGRRRHIPLRSHLQHTLQTWNETLIVAARSYHHPAVCPCLLAAREWEWVGGVSQRRSGGGGAASRDPLGAHRHPSSSAGGRALSARVAACRTQRWGLRP